MRNLSKEVGYWITSGWMQDINNSHLVAQYLSLESILNESDDSSVGEYYMEDYETFDGSSLNHFVSVYILHLSLLVVNLTLHEKGLFFRDIKSISWHS